MAIKFYWKPKKIRGTRLVPIGLELGGDDASLPKKKAGKIQLFEVKGKGKRHQETDDARLLATFHGNFHRDKSAKTPRRVTFDIAGSDKVQPHDQFVLGFDPECLIGVDAFVFTFLNREFQVNLPFFVDSHTEGSFLELQVIATAGGTELAKSAVLALPIRRKVSIATTNGLTFKDHVIGNRIAFHEHYLAGGVAWPQGKPTPGNQQFVPVPWTGPAAIRFAKYNSGNLKIILTSDMLSKMLPDEDEIKTNFGGVKDPKKTRIDLANMMRSRISARLKIIFDDAGFNGGSFLWDHEQPASAEMSKVKAAFRRTSRRGWQPKSQGKGAKLPFWTFVVTNDDEISPVGTSEGSSIIHAIRKGDQNYLLNVPEPIGGGEKEVVRLLKVRTAYFADELLGSIVRRTKFRSVAEFRNRSEVPLDKIAIVIAHEISHSLGMSHEVMTTNSSVFKEADAEPILSITGSSIENNTYGTRLYFPNQAKAIWKKAFRTSPNFDPGHLRNKSWGSNWATTDWTKRKSEFMKAHGANMMTTASFVSRFNETPPHAGKGKSAQRGTYVP